MSCCSDCIGDRGLSQHVFPTLNSKAGNCLYCNEIKPQVVTPIDLRDRFEMLLSAYTLDQKGENISDWFQKDWLMFPEMDSVHAARLLTEILDDGNITRQKFIPRPSDGESELLSWNSLCSELMHKNRFFPKSNLNLNRLNELFAHIIVRSDEIPYEWFRARIQEGKTKYSADKMGAPPKILASHGRANPVGIPYLYIASNALTAISEVRPHTGELISVATFFLKEELSFVDLRAPRKLVSPFMLTDENEVTLLRRDIAFLEYLGDELMRPVLPKGAAIDYIPTQYLCEFIKQCGFDGVIYNSSIGSNINLALFEPDNASAEPEITQHEVTSISIKTDT